MAGTQGPGWPPCQIVKRGVGDARAFGTGTKAVDDEISYGYGCEK